MVTSDWEFLTCLLYRKVLVWTVTRNLLYGKKADVLIEKFIAWFQSFHLVNYMRCQIN